MMSGRMSFKVRRSRRKKTDRAALSAGSLRAQLRQHSVALISLMVAVVSLGYNTWRNETSEVHRNWREAGFVLTTEVSQLRQIVLYRRYFSGRDDHPMEPMRDNQTWINGWGTATSIRDLSSILPDPLPAAGARVYATWSDQAGRLDAANEQAARAEKELLAAIDAMQQATLELINNLR